YRPLALFSWLALLFCLLGLIAGIPVIWEVAATGLVPRLPSALLAVALVFVGILAFASGLILDTVVKGTRKEYELQVTQAYERYGRRRA
ncbi:MAG: glycosyl transferase, partial [Eggerthella lenta]